MKKMSREDRPIKERYTMALRVGVITRRSVLLLPNQHGGNTLEFALVEPNINGNPNVLRFARLHDDMVKTIKDGWIYEDSPAARELLDLMNKLDLD